MEEPKGWPPSLGSSPLFLVALTAAPAPEALLGQVLQQFNDSSGGRAQGRQCPALERDVSESAGQANPSVHLGIILSWGWGPFLVLPGTLTRSFLFARRVQGENSPCCCVFMPVHLFSCSTGCSPQAQGAWLPPGCGFSSCRPRAVPQSGVQRPHGAGRGTAELTSRCSSAKEGAPNRSTASVVGLW